MLTVCTKLIRIIKSYTWWHGHQHQCDGADLTSKYDVGGKVTTRNLTSASKNTTSPNIKYGIRGSHTSIKDYHVVGMVTGTSVMVWSLGGKVDLRDKPPFELIRVMVTCRIVVYLLAPCCG